MIDYSNIPDEMKHAKRWLVWKAVDTRKLPYYVTGKERGKGGKLDSTKDIQQLATFDDAVRASSIGGYSGIGFALGQDETGKNWQGIDLDKVEENNLLELSNILPSYVEQSPSGKGFHAIGYGLPFKTLGSNGTGTEAYACSRYFTVTGKKIRGDICDVSQFVVDVVMPIHDAKHHSLLIEGVEDIEVTALKDSHDLQISRFTGFTDYDARGSGGEKKPLEMLSLDKLPVRCKPTTNGMRNLTVFHLARHLKSHYAFQSAEEARPFVREWFAESLPIIRTKGFTETWSDFRHAWKNVKTLEGEGKMDDILNMINFDTIPPPNLHEIGYEGSGWACVQLCYLLSTNADNKVFFLAGRKVEELLQIPQRTANNMLNMMVDDGILKVVKKGDRHKATTYQFNWEPLEI